VDNIATKSKVRSEVRQHMEDYNVRSKHDRTYLSIRTCIAPADWAVIDDLKSNQITRFFVVAYLTAAKWTPKTPLHYTSAGRWALGRHTFSPAHVTRARSLRHHLLSFGRSRQSQAPKVIAKSTTVSTAKIHSSDANCNEAGLFLAFTVK
jgi:hypothetical protein